MIDLTDHVFYPLEKNFDSRLLTRLRHSEIEFIDKLSSLSQKYELTSTISKDKMIWKDSDDAVHLILHFNIKSSGIKKILNVYKYTRHHSNIQNFILVDQTQTPKQAYDIFRLNQLSFMQHCNHFRIKHPDFTRENHDKPRQPDLYSLFSSLKPNQKYRWGKIFANQKTVFASLEKECKKNNLNQVVKDNYVFWINGRDEIQCLILLVYDPTNIDTFINLYSEILEKNIKLTFCIVNQIPDGEYEFDLFRLSESSYLEHCNRVKPRVIQNPLDNA